MDQVEAPKKKRPPPKPKTATPPAPAAAPTSTTSSAQQAATPKTSKNKAPTPNAPVPTIAKSPARKPPAGEPKKDKDGERVTVPMNVSNQFSEIDHLLPHIEAMDVPREMAVPMIKRMFPHGVPQSAMSAVHAMFDMMNVLGPVPSSINPLFTMAMGGYSATDAGAAQHAATLDIIAAMSAALRNRTPHVQTNRIAFDASVADLQAVVARCMVPRGPGAYGEHDAADAVLTYLENEIIAYASPYDESRNLGLFLSRAPVPRSEMRLPEFNLKDIIDNLVPVAVDNTEFECVWGKMCMALAHGTQLTFRTRNIKRKPLAAWRKEGVHNETGMCFLCEIVHTCGMVYAYQRIGRAPKRVLQRFRITCDAEIGLPADALIFPDSAFNGLIAPFVKADWLFTHLIPPADDARAGEPYHILRGYFRRR